MRSPKQGSILAPEQLLPAAFMAELALNVKPAMSVPESTDFSLAMGKKK